MNTVIMGSYTDVKNLIISNIKANGQREITGPILQDVLLNMLENSSRVEEITYSDLKTLRDGTKLTPSRLYRITDYITTTVQSNTKSAGHHFDVIVLALSETELLEQAWVIHHEGDEYFTNNNLSAWKIWYCIDNDTNRFAWADATNGKGVIYRMIDEFNNDVPYDFKNIQFKHPKDTTTYPHYYYTFASGNVKNNTDYSLSITNNCYSNVIKEYISSDKRILNQIIFIGSDCSYNILGYNCINNTFGNNCQHNTFDDNCQYNTFGPQCSFNTFRNSCWYNILGSVCSNNILGSDCFYNTFGEACSYNTLGSSCWQIKFASDKSASTKYNYYKNNHFGDGCQYILFKGIGTDTPSDQVQNYNFSQGLKGTSSSYLIIDGKRNRAYETYISRDTDGTIKESVIAEFENRLGNCVDLTTEQTINATKTFSAGIDLNGTRISKVGSPINTDDVANKEYVDDAVKTVDDKVNDFKNAGYLYAGVATSLTNPGSPDTKVFYIANGKGEYPNFGGLDVTEDDVVILYYDTIWHKVATGIASNEKLAELSDYAHKGEVRHIERDLGMYPELEPVPLNSEVTGKYINSDGKYVDASDWNIASIGAVSLGNTYLLNMVSSANMVLGVALFVSRVYKRDKEGKIIGTTLTPLFSAKNTSIPASGYVLFEAMDDYEEVLICYKPELTTQMLVARWGFKASHATQLRNLRLIVDNKTDFEGIYELLTAGYALNLVGKGNGEPQAFLSRKTGGGNITDGSAVIKEVDGVQPIVWNQLCKHSIPKVTVDGIAVTVDNGVATIEVSENRTVGSQVSIGVANIKQNGVYLHQSNEAVENGIEFYCAGMYGLRGASSGVNSIERANSLYLGLMPINIYVGTNVPSGTYTYRLRFIDLTQMFGAGNEPSTYEEYLNRISHYHIKDAYAYNAGEVVNYLGTGIKTTGRQLWNEEWELGSYSRDTGEKTSAGKSIRCKNLIPIESTSLYCKSSAEIVPIYYDANKSVIGSNPNGWQNRIEQVPSGTKYITFYVVDSYGTTYNHDICINLSDPAFNGQYEPYKSYVRDWSEVMKKYFPDGMTSLNGVKDFFDDKKAVRKWGCKVFDGTEDWRYYKDYGNFHDFVAGIEDIVNVNRPLSCNLYPNYMWVDKSIHNTPYYENYCINVIDSAYDSVESWKAHLADLYAQGNPLVVYYELAEPVEDIFEKPLNLTYTVINGGTETSLATENSTQFEGSIFYGKDYVGVIDELQLQNRVTQIEFENWEN